MSNRIIPYDPAEFIALVERGQSTREIMARMDISENTVYYRCKIHRVKLAGSRYAKPAPELVEPQQHAATAPHYPDLVAALRRAKGTATPTATINSLATRFRMPSADVQGVAESVWR